MPLCLYFSVQPTVHYAMCFCIRKGVLEQTVLNRGVKVSLHQERFTGVGYNCIIQAKHFYCYCLLDPGPFDQVLCLHVVLQISCKGKLTDVPPSFLPLHILSTSPLQLILSIIGLFTCFPSLGPPVQSSSSATVSTLVFHNILCPYLSFILVGIEARQCCSAQEPENSLIFCVPVASHGNTCTTKAYHFYMKSTTHLPYQERCESELLPSLVASCFLTPPTIYNPVSEVHSECHLCNTSFSFYPDNYIFAVTISALVILWISHCTYPVINLTDVRYPIPVLLQR